MTASIRTPILCVAFLLLITGGGNAIAQSEFCTGTEDAISFSAQYTGQSKRPQFYGAELYGVQMGVTRRGFLDLALGFTRGTIDRADASILSGDIGIQPDSAHWVGIPFRFAIVLHYEHADFSIENRAGVAGQTSISYGIGFFRKFGISSRLELIPTLIGSILTAGSRSVGVFTIESAIAYRVGWDKRNMLFVRPAIAYPTDEQPPARGLQFGLVRLFYH